MAIHAACCRCANWFEYQADGAGFFRDYVGLCSQCKGEVGDIDKAIKRKTGRLRALSEEAKNTRRELNDATGGRDAARDRIWGLGGSAFNFFAALGAVALAGKGLDVPGPHPDTGWGDLDSIPEGPNFRPENLAAGADVTEHFGPAAGLDRYGARAYPFSNIDRETSLHTGIRAYTAETMAFDEAVQRGEIVVRTPWYPDHRVMRGGPDFITAVEGRRGSLHLYFTDISMTRQPSSVRNRFKTPARTVPSKWVKKYLMESVKGHPEERRLRNAIKGKRFHPSQVNVDFSPEAGGQGRTTLIRTQGPGRVAAPTRAVPAPAPPSRVASARRLGAGAMDRLDKAGKVAGVVTALLAFAAATDSLSEHIGDYFLSRRAADDAQKRLDAIDADIAKTTAELTCLRGEKDNQASRDHA